LVNSVIVTGSVLLSWRAAYHVNNRRSEVYFF
jgi:hypothetical protein